MPTPAVVTPPINSACSECGTIKKSGKLSCCGRGGSWFGICRSDGNTNLGHTWYEGIQACKAQQFQSAVVQQPHAYQAKRNVSVDDASIVMKPKGVIVTAQLLVSTPVNMSTSKPAATTTTVHASTSILMPANMSAAYDTDTATSKAINVTISTIIDTTMNMLTPKPTIYPVNGTITFPVNETTYDSANPIITPFANPIIFKSLRRVPFDISMTTVSHTSVSTPVIALEHEKLFNSITHIGILLMISLLVVT